MDATAIMMAKEEEIQVLGLTQKGDILALRAFCKQNSETTNEERTEKKRKLLETLKSKLPRSKTFKRKVESISESLPVKVPCRKISIGWQHFDELRSRYIAVRMGKGGTPDISFPLCSTKDDILKQI